MSILRVQLLALLVLPVLANAALSATLRISRLDGFNASNRQPTVWLNQGAAIDIPMNRPIEFQVEPGKHTITIATRVPADPSQFMQRQHEQIILEAGDVFEIELKWVAGIFVGKHEVKISRIDTPRVTPTATQLSSTQPVIEVKPILSGQGVRTWPDGTQSEGYLVNGLVQGFGITKFANGNR